MVSFSPFAIARTIGALLIILPTGFLINELTGLCYGSIIFGILLIVSNMDT